MKSRTAVLWLVTCLAIPAARAQAPAGWIVSGTAPGDFEFVRDATTAESGRYSMLIEASAPASADHFGTLMQVISAENYRGSRWKLSGYLKTDTALRALMWIRVSGPENILAFDNMASRPVTGTTDWTRYEIVFEVPADSVDIAFGFLLSQSGKVWGDDFRLEKADGIPLTAHPIPAKRLTAHLPWIPKAPINLDFED
jgi:AraC family transcriptional regulator